MAAFRRSAKVLEQFPHLFFARHVVQDDPHGRMTARRHHFIEPELSVLGVGRNDVPGGNSLRKEGNVVELELPGSTRDGPLPFPNL